MLPQPWHASQSGAWHHLDTLNMLNMLDWACLTPRLQTRLAEPRSVTGYKAPPAAASALSTFPIQKTGFLELCTNKARVGG
jgi:hypothetical protein